MKVVFAGNNLRAVKCLEFLIKKKITIPLVISHHKKSEGLYFQNLIKISKQLNLNCVSPKNINSIKLEKILKKINPDLLVLCGYSQNILKEKIYNLPKYGTWNLHASDLPKYRGASPLNWSILNGEKKIGISIIQVDKSLDGGDILAKSYINLKKDENIRSLTLKVNRVYPKLLYSKINDLRQNKVKKIKQSLQNSTFFSKRYPKDSFLKFAEMNAEDIKKIILSSIKPYTGAFFYFNNKQFYVNENVNIKPNYFGVPGRVVKRIKSSIIVACKKGSIEINEIFYKNKKVEPSKVKIISGVDLN